MNAFTESFEKLTRFGTEGFEPVRDAAGVAVDGIEKLARTNYALAGDVLEFAVESARLPLSVSEPRDYLDRQMAATKSFSDVLSGRFNEYVELGKALQSQMADAADVEAAQPVKKTRRKRKAS